MDTLRNLQSKITPHKGLQSQLDTWRAANKKIIFTNGCFDILHRGHVEYLSKAADMGDILIIGLNTDHSVSRLKGKNRPINDQYSRALLLSALSFVDAITLFDEDTPLNLITMVKPDILVKGGDYNVDDIVGHDIVEAYGGKVVTIPLTNGYSTTKTIEKMKG